MFLNWDKFGDTMKKPEKPPIVQENPTYGEIMDELIKAGKFSNFFEIEDAEYPYWEEWKYKSKDWGITPNKIWSCVKSARRAKKRIDFSRMPGFTFEFSTPSIIQKYLHELDLNLGGSLQTLQPQ